MFPNLCANTQRAGVARRSVGVGLALLAPVVMAHDGHGLSGVHWHATDVWGFVALGLLVAVAVWLSRK